MILPRILFTGSRNWTDVPTVWRVMRELAEQHAWSFTAVHGDCPTGADQHVHQWIHLQRVLRVGSYDEDRHPARWDLHGTAAGPIRNLTMVNSQVVEVHAFPLGRSAGTYGTIRLARAAGIPVHIHQES